MNVIIAIPIRFSLSYLLIRFKFNYRQNIVLKDEFKPKYA